MFIQPFDGARICKSIVSDNLALLSLSLSLVHRGFIRIATFTSKADGRSVLSVRVLSRCPLQLSSIKSLILHLLAFEAPPIARWFHPKSDHSRLKSRLPFEIDANARSHALLTTQRDNLKHGLLRPPIFDEKYLNLIA